jgi:CheY-like chemotaxis protein
MNLSKTYHLVLADDDDDDILFFREALMDLPIRSELKCLKDGEQLLTYLSSLDSNQMPDLIFLDINMPCKNGIHCVCEIREDEKYQTVPIIMFTESGNQKFILETRKCGANKYLKKPQTFNGLVDILTNILSVEGYRSLFKNKKYVLT